MRHLGIGYSDILMMPTGERRYYLGLLVRQKHEQEEMAEEIKSKSNGKGTKQTQISGEALKNKIKAGNIQI